jgi:hypothetical protein
MHLRTSIDIAMLAYAARNNDTEENVSIDVIIHNSPRFTRDTALSGGSRGLTMKNAITTNIVGVRSDRIGMLEMSFVANHYFFAVQNRMHPTTASNNRSDIERVHRAPLVMNGNTNFQNGRHLRQGSYIRLNCLKVLSNRVRVRVYTFRTVYSEAITHESFAGQLIPYSGHCTIRTGSRRRSRNFAVVFRIFSPSDVVARVCTCAYL